MKRLLLGGALAAIFAGAALAGGQFTETLPSASEVIPFSGSEEIPVDTHLSQGRQPQTVAATLAELGNYFTGYNGTYRNVLIGGDFGNNPWVRGTTSGDIANTLTYQADRWWNLGAAGSAINVTKQTGASDVFGTTAATLRFQRKAANADVNAICTGQVIESADSYRFRGKTAVFSFTAKHGANFSAASSLVTVTIAYGTGVDGTSTNFAAGSWTGYVAATASPVTLTTSFVRNTVTAAIPATAAQVGVKICYTPVGTAGANDWFEFGQAQLEATDQTAATAIASVFEPELWQVAIGRAQRHAWTLVEPAAGVCQATGFNSSTTAAFVSVPNPTTMRAAPTVTSIGAALANTTWAVYHAATSTALATPFVATRVANTTGMVNLTATVAAGLTAGQGSQLCGAGGGGILLVSADL